MCSTLPRVRSMSKLGTQQTQTKAQKLVFCSLYVEIQVCGGVFIPGYIFAWVSNTVFDTKKPRKAKHTEHAEISLANSPATHLSHP